MREELRVDQAARVFPFPSVAVEGEEMGNRLVTERLLRNDIALIRGRPVAALIESGGETETCAAPLPAGALRSLFVSSMAGAPGCGKEVGLTSTHARTVVF